MYLYLRQNQCLSFPLLCHILKSTKNTDAKMCRPRWSKSIPGFRMPICFGCPERHWADLLWSSQPVNLGANTTCHSYSPSAIHSAILTEWKIAQCVIQGPDIHITVNISLCIICDKSISNGYPGNLAHSSRMAAPCLPRY